MNNFNMNNSAPLKVLVVDDNDSLRRNLVAMLADENFDVSEARSGEAALTELGHQSFNVALVDMRLPGMSGNEFIEQASSISPALRFLIHTGSADYLIPPNISALGVSDQDVFLKPISDIEKLFGRIRGLCQKIAP